MSDKFSGGCVCGAIRYQCLQPPVAMLNCHCKDCQRSSGAPFASGIVVLAAELEITGSVKSYSVRGDSGKTVTRSFCANCGTPLFTQGEKNTEVISIRFSSLDRPTDFKPALDIWTSSAQSWVCLDPNIPHIPQSP